MSEPTVADVKARIDAFTDEYPYAEWHIAHVQLSDYNLSDGSIASAIEDIARFRVGQPPTWVYAGEPWSYEEWLDSFDGVLTPYHTIPEYLDATDEVLRWLLTVPEDVRDRMNDDDLTT